MHCTNRVQCILNAIARKDTPRTARTLTLSLARECSGGEAIPKPNRVPSPHFGIFLLQSPTVFMLPLCLVVLSLLTGRVLQNVGAMKTVEASHPFEQTSAGAPAGRWLKRRVRILLLTRPVQRWISCPFPASRHGHTDGTYLQNVLRAVPVQCNAQGNTCSTGIRLPQ